VVSSCYNGEGNLKEFHSRIVDAFRQLPDYVYEIVVADNCSTDTFVALIVIRIHCKKVFSDLLFQPSYI